ncbi:hypothetical protein [Aureimonas glaciei]|uniref:Uncharacterized protein n=1 Tax=Aureimonas glaciei TaxID=1776957 RepID=A0A917DC66_9HYPH|nr:hypothetical protein [Aureimonas glaciei]GGD24212.1 hypothetical protein GCM10011335_28930 [Aureimonas glaciei]
MSDRQDVPPTDFFVDVDSGDLGRKLGREIGRHLSEADGLYDVHWSPGSQSYSLRFAPDGPLVRFEGCCLFGIWIDNDTEIQIECENIWRDGRVDVWGHTRWVASHPVEAARHALDVYERDLALAPEDEPFVFDQMTRKINVGPRP